MSARMLALTMRYAGHWASDIEGELWRRGVPLDDFGMLVCGCRMCIDRRTRSL